MSQQLGSGATGRLLLTGPAQLSAIIDPFPFNNTLVVLQSMQWRINRVDNTALGVPTDTADIRIRIRKMHNNIATTPIIWTQSCNLGKIGATTVGGANLPGGYVDFKNYPIILNTRVVGGVPVIDDEIGVDYSQNGTAFNATTEIVMTILGVMAIAPGVGP